MVKKGAQFSVVKFTEGNKQHELLLIVRKDNKQFLQMELDEFVKINIPGGCL